MYKTVNKTFMFITDKNNDSSTYGVFVTCHILVQ